MDAGIPDRFETTLKPLWLQAQAGDEAAYREALKGLAAGLRGYLRRRLQATPDEVEDLVQETLLSIHLQRGTYDPTLPLGAWVRSIARHKLIDAWRRRGRREAFHEPLESVAESLLATEDEDPGARRDLMRLLATLPDAQRRAIELTKLDGLSVAEAARTTGASATAIKTQVHRGLKRLAALVRRGG